LGGLPPNGHFRETGRNWENSAAEFPTFFGTAKIIGDVTVTNSKKFRAIVWRKLADNATHAISNSTTSPQILN